MKNIYKCINGCDEDACDVVCFNNNPPTKCIYFPNHTVEFVLQKPDDPKAPPKCHIDKITNVTFN